MTIIEALHDPSLLGGLSTFRDLSSWCNWLVMLKAIYGLPLEAQEQAVFRRFTGRTRYAPPPGGYAETVTIVGRQAGKDTVAAAIVDFEALRTAPHGDGTTFYAAGVAQDHRGALRTFFSYACAPFETVPLLRSLVVGRTTDTLSLANGVTIAGYPCRPPAIRGVRLVVGVCSELAFFRSEQGHSVDAQMLQAMRPCLATTRGKLIILSSPYGQSGALWDLHRRHYGRDDSPVLVWQASAPDMNPTLPADYLTRMAQDDPEAYRSEVLGEFRAGVSTFFDPDALAACIASGVRERPPVPDASYFAFADPSGGRSDRFALAVAHAEGSAAVLDVVRAWAPPFNPIGVVAEAAALLRRYRVDRVQGDRYAAGFAAESFRAHGLAYEAAPHDRSTLYLELLPRVNAGAVVLLDLPDLLRELRGLERRRGLSGRDRVDHRPGEHDDAANAVGGVLVAVAEDLGRPPLRLLGMGSEEAEAPEREEAELWARGDMPATGRPRREATDAAAVWLLEKVKEHRSWFPGD